MYGSELEPISGRQSLTRGKQDKYKSHTNLTLCYRRCDLHSNGRCIVQEMRFGTYGPGMICAVYEICRGEARGEGFCHIYRTYTST